MPDLLKRYSFDWCIDRIGAFAGWIDGVCSDLLLARRTMWTWGQARLARDLCVDLSVPWYTDANVAAVRTALLDRLSNIPQKNSWALNERLAKHFPPQSGDSRGS